MGLDWAWWWVGPSEGTTLSATVERYWEAPTYVSTFIRNEGSNSGMLESHEFGRHRAGRQDKSK